MSASAVSRTDVSARSNGVKPLGRRLVELLDPEPDDLVVGLGPGASCHCLAMLELVSLNSQLVLVDSSRKRLGRLETAPSVRLVGMSALEFARFPMQWDKVLLDHVLAAENGDGADELLRLVFRRLRAGGRMVAILSASAHPRSATLQRSMALGSRLRSCGFDVSFETVQRVSHRWDLVVGRKRAHA